jgi:hypothetical protein
MLDLTQTQLLLLLSTIYKGIDITSTSYLTNVKLIK